MDQNFAQPVPEPTTAPRFHECQRGEPRQPAYLISVLYKQDQAVLSEYGVCLCDRSNHGLGLFSHTPMETSETVSVSLRDENGIVSRSQYIVKHCGPSQQGKFRVGLELLPPLAQSQPFTS